MILNSKISLQPKQEVLIERKAPTKMFAKLLHSLTSGLTSEKEKHQTFTAISMLQEINIALRQANINNIVRLAKDGNDFYYDAHGRDNDLAEAMKEFKINTDALSGTLFNDLYLVLEHDDGQLRYLIEIDIQRVHKVDELPIKINVSGVIKALEAKSGETPEQLSQRLGQLFCNSQDFDKFTNRNRLIFDRFTQSLEQQFRMSIRCEDVKLETKPQVLRVKESHSSFANKRKSAPTVHQGYPGWDGFAMYSLCWMGMMSSLNVQAQDMDVISESSEVLLSIGEEGIDAGSAAIFDMNLDDQKFERADASFAGSADNSSGDTDSSSSWLDFGGDDGGSSCGSSCGGGCGS